jgi:hypothetical protein
MRDVPVSVWSFRDVATAAAAASHVERVGIPASQLSRHDNLAGSTWLFVPGEHESQAREVIRTAPELGARGAIEVVAIAEGDLPRYATRYGKRLSRTWAAWLVIFLWPLGFGSGFWWEAVSFLAFFAAVLVVAKIVFICPCCRKPVDIWTMHYDAVPCSWCGISPDRKTGRRS